MKDVGGLLCMNPGKITKGKTAGTFARFTVHPDKNSKEPTRVSSRTRVDVVRL